MNNNTCPRDIDYPPSSSTLFLPGVFVACLVVLIAGAIVIGPFVSVDTGRFLTAGNAYIEGTLTWRDLDESIELANLPLQYFVSSVLLTTIYQYWGLGVWGVVVFNCVLFALIACALFTAWNAIYGGIEFSFNRPATWIGALGGLYVIFGLPDGFLWSYWVMTEIVFLFWITLFLVLIVKGFVHGGRLLWSLALVVAATAVFVRPPGMIVPVLYCLALLLYLRPIPRRYFWHALGTGAVLPLILVFFVVPGLVLMSVENRPALEYIIPDALRGFFRQSVYYFERGIVISDRLELKDVAPLSYGDIIKSISYRLAHYWIPLRFGEHSYSLIHNVVNFFYIVLIIPLLLSGAKSLINGDTAQRMIMLFLFMVAYSYAMLHAVTMVSYEWRYQLPAMVPVWIVAGYGWWQWSNRWLHRRAEKANVV